ncbi:MAG: mannonate dehydratase [Spirochaetes bacterium]|nr:MAG: mannonate dehydratase [Spirochaetota bacterium]
MQMTFRWFGEGDAIPLEYIRQIPSVKGIVSALYDIPVGDEWPADKIAALKRRVGDAGLVLSVIESIPVHEDIKLGRPSRDRYIEAYRASVRNMGSQGIPVLCYNFMPVFDWTRTDLEVKNPDGSTCLCYDHDRIGGIDIRGEGLELPGWATAYTRAELTALLDAYAGVSDEALWENLEYFLKAVVPVAAESGVKMAIHPDDPPWPIFGLPRIVKDEADLDRLVNTVDSPSNGITFCTGSLGPNRSTELVRTIGKFARMGRVHFVHLRNIRRSGERSFCETAHTTESGDIDVYAVMKELVDADYRGMMRPDHGRMIWGEKGRPGYGLHDRALGAMYLWGLWEGLNKSKGDR